MPKDKRYLMPARCRRRTWQVVRVLAIALAAAATCSVPALAASGDVECKNLANEPVIVGPKAITIYNNSDVTIFPVLTTSPNEINEWLQACFRTQDPMPMRQVGKLYVNEGSGMPPDSSVTITLPLYSEVEGGNYLTWWNGGRAVLADDKTRTRDSHDTSITTPPEVTMSCVGTGVECDLKAYLGASQLDENVYAQLSEYTFGASDQAADGLRIFRPANVGYNISYVDHVYLPVAIAPKGNPYIGYSGSVQPLADFRENLTKFLEPGGPGDGWPAYNLNPGASGDHLKLPGGYNVFAQRDGLADAQDDMPARFNDDPGTPGVKNKAPVLTVYKCLTEGACTDEEQKTLRFGTAVQRMQDLWGSCANWGDEDLRPWVKNKNVACPTELKENFWVIRDFFAQNHKNYLEAFPGPGCTGNAPPQGSETFAYWTAILHIYGWSSFNAGCGGGVNQLAGTKIPGWDHAKTQQMYIHDLQYAYRQGGALDPALTFNPYVKLIHDDLELSAYAFSVDDAVGFMAELGDGLDITVGGPTGLENEKAFDYAGGFQVIVATPDHLIGKFDDPILKSYGVCVIGAAGHACDIVDQDVTMPDHTQVNSFRIGTVPEYPIKVAFTDLDDNVYSFVVPHAFEQCAVDADPVGCPPDKPVFRQAILDSCAVVTKDKNSHPKSTKFCDTLNPNQSVEDRSVRSFLVFHTPANYQD